MKIHDVQSVTLAKPANQVFDFIANPANLPKWTNAFKEANTETAQLVTPQGTVPIQLKTTASANFGTVDWQMTFPEGSIGTAFSRITPIDAKSSIYTFILMAPPVPLEMLEGALSAQIEILKEELLKLKGLLDA